MKSIPLFIEKAAFTVAAIATSGAAYAQAPQQQAQGQRQQRPNVLFIASDDLCSAMNAFGDPRVHTPNLDRLAEKGVIFNRAYNQSPLSGPSRASIMTGCRPDRTGVHDLSGKFRYAMPDAVTLSQLFKNNGYYTCRVGKIYHAGVPSDIGQPGSDDPQSWNVAYNPIGRDRTDEYLLQGHRTPGTWLAIDCEDNEMTDAISANVAISLLRGRFQPVGSAYMGPASQSSSFFRPNAQPFFMAVGFYRPHVPYIAPKKYFDMYPDVDIPEEFEEEWLTKPSLARTATSWNSGVSREDCLNAVRAYYASITFIDTQIGKLIDALEEFGVMDNTIIVFWSDHGYMLGDHGLWQKQNLFERTAHQPLFIYAPGKAQGKCDAVVEMIDIYPTIAELAGLELQTPVDGRSLVPLMNNPAAQWNYPAFTQQARTLYPEGQDSPMRQFFGGGEFMFNPSLSDKNTTVFGRSVRVDRYRYTEWDEGRKGCELYDYETDPEEHVNLVNDKKYAKLVEELSATLHSSYDAEEIRKTQETIAKNREEANRKLEPLYPQETY